MSGGTEGKCHTMSALGWKSSELMEFCGRVQMDDETPEQFLTSLRKLAIDSGLAEDEKSYNQIVIGRFIAGISDHDMRQKIMTSQKICQYCQDTLMMHIWLLSN